MQVEELIDNLSFLEDWEERYRYIIELGRKLPAFPEESRIELNKVKGCMSQVWMVPEVRDGDERMYFLADSDAHIVKGLIAVLLTIYSGKSSTQILTVDIEDIFQQIGLSSHLSPNRRNGFFAMVQRIREIAQAKQAATVQA